MGLVAGGDALEPGGVEGRGGVKTQGKASVDQGWTQWVLFVALDFMQLVRAAYNFVVFYGFGWEVVPHMNN